MISGRHINNGQFFYWVLISYFSNCFASIYTVVYSDKLNQIKGHKVLQFTRLIHVQKVAANTSNKQSWTADNGWSSSLGVGRRANNSTPQNKKETAYYEM